MIPADLPDWAVVLVVVLAVAGSAVSLLGASGLVRLTSFYERVHAPTLGATLGMVLVLAASALFFGIIEQRFLPRELLIAIFLTVTTPVTLILLARAALFRDRAEDGAKEAATGEAAVGEAAVGDVPRLPPDAAGAPVIEAAHAPEAQAPEARAPEARAPDKA